MIKTKTLVTILFLVLLVSFPVFYLIFARNVTGKEKIVGTHYTASTWAPSFWSNLDIYEVGKDFAAIKENGFNTVIIIVPWTGFQTSVTPILCFDDYFALLNSLFVRAKQAGLNVILRIGYAHEIGVDSVPSHYERAVDLFNDSTIWNAWTDYLGRLHNLTSKYDNFLFGFLTWEDFFFIDLTRVPLEKRTSLADRTGYQKYLENHGLHEISEMYGESFSSYKEIPIPSFNSSAVPLFYKFWNQFLIAIYQRSKEYFPKLSMEVRMHCDPSSEFKKYHCHERTFNLGGVGDLTIIYYTSSLAAPNQGDRTSANDAIFRLKNLLNWVKSHTGNSIFIDQFNFFDNTPGFEQDTRIASGELPKFIEKSFEILRDDTIGYALWTMKDVRGNLIKNGSFERGTLGWRIHNGEVLTRDSTQQHGLLLGNMGTLRQDIGCGSYVHPVINRKDVFFRFRFKVKKAGQNPSRLILKVIDNRGKEIFHQQIHVVAKNYETIALEKLPLFSSATLELSNSVQDIILDDLVLFFVIQQNGIYDVFGEPKSFRDNIVYLNRKLSTVRNPR